MSLRSTLTCIFHDANFLLRYLLHMRCRCTLLFNSNQNRTILLDWLTALTDRLSRNLDLVQCQVDQRHFCKTIRSKFQSEFKILFLFVFQSNVSPEMDSEMVCNVDRRPIFRILLVLSSNVTTSVIFLFRRCFPMSSLTSAKSLNSGPAAYGGVVCLYGWQRDSCTLMLRSAS